MGCTTDLPNPINIQYEDMHSVKRFLLSWEGQYLTRLAINDEYKINFYPSDVYSDFDLDGNDIYNEFYNILVEVPNIKIWNTESYGDKTNYYPGTQIIDSIKPLVNKLRDIDFGSIDKKYHFLTLNNIGKREREELFNFFQKYPKVSEQSLSSFLWKGIRLDKSKNWLDNVSQRKEWLYESDALNKYYSECAIEIVVESGPNMITEKILKPLLMGTPFLLHNNNMINLYPTFNNLMGIDFNYFGIEYDKVHKSNPTNIKQVQKKIIEISKTPLSELKDKYSGDFKKAKENRKKILEIWDTLPILKKPILDESNENLI